MNNIKEYLLGRINRANERVSLIKESHGENPNKTHNYFGGQNLGYWQGMLNAYDNVLYEIEEMEKKA